ncbi:MAG: hypothetical protein II978_03100 [Clostridia bacterium]|nr:hypothetical protein [Clostridia bacterium]
MQQIKPIPLATVIKIFTFTEEKVKNKFKVRYRHSNTTNSFYLELVGADNVKYNLRFSDHQPKDKRTKTFYLTKNYKQKDLEKFVDDGIYRAHIKQMNFLFKKIA